MMSETGASFVDLPKAFHEMCLKTIYQIKHSVNKFSLWAITSTFLTVSTGVPQA